MNTKNLSKSPFSEYEALLNIADTMQKNEKSSEELREKLAEIKSTLDKSLEKYFEAKTEERNYEGALYTAIDSLVENPVRYNAIRTRVHDTQQQVIKTFQQLSSLIHAAA